MTHGNISTIGIACTFAIAVSALACSNGPHDANSTDANRTGRPPAAGAAEPAGTPGASGTAGTAAANGGDRSTSPVTLVGCLQKGDGRSDYILTEINTPKESVGTSGAAGTSGADTVAQERLQAAEHAYRLSGDHDNLEPLVGKRVRVSGTLAQASDLNAHDDNGKMKDRDRAKIGESDLAKVDVASVDSVADTCGGKASGRKARSK